MERNQLVDLNGTQSKMRGINTGVPQGSILGPLLFLIYMNDIAKCTNIFDVISYADDTTLVSSIGQLELRHPNGNLCDIINTELGKVNDWLRVNKLSLNVGKTKFMIFHKKGKKIIDLSLSINGVTLERVVSFTFLGLTIDENISWKVHINKISSKIARTVGILSRLKRFLPKSIMIIIYNSLILPYLNYCLLCWGYVCTDRILSLQKKAVRHITRSRYNEHTTPLFQDLKFLKIDDLYILVLMKFYYKFTKKLPLPVYLMNLNLKLNDCVHQHNTRSRYSIHREATRKVFTEGTINHQLSSLRSYVREKPPPRLADYVVNTHSNSSKVNKLHSKPRSIINSIFDKIMSVGLNSFVKYCKISFISTYVFVCNKEKCFVCGR